MTLAILCAGMAVVTSCTKDVKLGDPIEIVPDYVLPQTGASDEDNARIVELYEKWGSYVLYDINPDDIFWKQISGNASSGGRVNKYTEGDPANVGAMLDYMEKIWWKYFPDEFMKAGGAPYRIYIVDEYYIERDFGGGEIMKYPANYYIGENSVIVAGMNSVSTYDEATISARKVELINAMWNYYVSNGILSTPAEFYTISDYTTEPEMTYDASQYGYIYTDEQLEALRNRGFIPKYNQYGYTKYDEIYMKYSETNSTWSTSDPRSNDFNYYISQIFNATDEQVAEFLKYETVKTKWNIILDYYKKNYDIDLRSIATE